MTFAWYGYLDSLRSKPLIVAVLICWGIAFFEYVFQVPGNRAGDDYLKNKGQLKILQEVISLSIFVPFSIYWLKEPLKWDYLWAGLCILGAVFFIFRSKIMAG
jgi:uncharacterized protein (DUF486 family)